MTKVLLVTGGGWHNFDECSRILADLLKNTGKAEVTVTQDRKILGSPELKSYDQVVMYTQGGKLTGKEEQGITSFVKGGKGFLGIHCAADSFVENPKYIEMVGGKFIDHGPCQEFGVNVANKEHDLTRRFGNFRITDELYVLDEVQGDNKNVLLSSFWKGKMLPMAYTKDYGKGKVVYLALGHDRRAFTNPEFQKLCLRSINWLGGAAEKKPVRCAAIGYGGAFNMGKMHGQQIKEAGMEYVAVCDVDRARLAEAERDFPGIKTYDDPDKLAADPDVDLVVVITPHNSHAPLSIKCLKAGKHVVTEKPFCITVNEANQMIDAANKAGVMLSVFHNRRWDGDFMTIREVIEKGIIGDVFHLEAYFGGYGHPGTWWRSDKQISGGAFYDWGAHFVDWVLNLMPYKMESITGFFHKRVWFAVSNEDHCQAIIRFEGGRVADIQHSSIARAGKPRFRILGTKGAIVDSWGGSFKVYTDVEGVNTEMEVKYREGQWKEYWRNVADHLMGGDPLVVTAEQARRVIAVIETAEKSSAAGKTLPAPVP
ncbi:MAG TPA: ThuA domain-containing protein [Planctomycetota bacterium]|nr:ThuA domain-containing protein [Planctomycetota bacterium]